MGGVKETSKLNDFYTSDVNLLKLKKQMSHYGSHFEMPYSKQSVYAYYREFKSDSDENLKKISYFAGKLNPIYVFDLFKDKGQTNLCSVINQMRFHDILIVNSFDQLANSLPDLLSVVKGILKKDAILIITDFGRISCDSEGDRFIYNLEALTKSSKRMRSNSIKEGKSQKINSKIGRPKRVIDDRYYSIYKMMKKQRMSYQKASQVFNISKSTLYRIKKQIEDVD